MSSQDKDLKDLNLNVDYLPLQLESSISVFLVVKNIHQRKQLTAI